MKIVSPAFGHNEKIPGKYTCNGENISPPLEFLEVPAGAKSLVLIADDPDAISGNWVHWVVYNIDPNAGAVEENAIAKGGIEGMTSFGNYGYGGPCPPSGTHRYFFKLYALDKVLQIAEGADRNIVMEMISGAIIDQCELIGLYSQQ